MAVKGKREMSPKKIRLIHQLYRSFMEKKKIIIKVANEIL